MKRIHLRLRDVVLLTCLSAMVAGCKANESPHQRSLDMPLDDGGVVSDVLRPETLSVVLIYSPSQCFSCSGLLHRWVEFAGDHEADLKLILTKKPSPAEARTLRFLRVDVAGVLASELADPGLSAAYLVRASRVVDAAAGTQEQAAMLEELTTPLGHQKTSLTPNERHST